METIRVRYLAGTGVGIYSELGVESRGRGRRAG
jgi:hypothetical protein